MHRHVFGALGLLLLVIGAVLAAYGSEQESRWLASGGVVRAGLLLVAIWWAMPERADQIEWPRVASAGGLILVIVLAARYPRILWIALPYVLVIGFAAYLLRPRRNRRRPGRR